MRGFFIWYLRERSFASLRTGSAAIFIKDPSDFWRVFLLGCGTDPSLRSGQGPQPYLLKKPFRNVRLFYLVFAGEILRFAQDRVRCHIF
jgi:hypothetical protein